MIKVPVTVHWSDGESRYIAKYQRKEGDWRNKRLDRSIERGSESEALQTATEWYFKYLQGSDSESAPKASGKKTIRNLIHRWLEMRYRDPDTKPNTYDGLYQSAVHWILDHKDYQHESIQDLDIETELTPQVMNRYLDSLRRVQPGGKLKGRALATSSVLVHVSALNTFFEQSFAMRWIQVPSPILNPMVQRKLKGLRESKHNDQNKSAYVTREQLFGLVTSPTSKIPDMRRVKYLFGYSTGLRPGEIQAVRWRDLYLDGTPGTGGIPFVEVRHQLKKQGTIDFVHYRDWSVESQKDKIQEEPRAILDDPKRNIIRKVPLHPCLVRVLRRWLETGWKGWAGKDPTPDHPVFPVGGKVHSIRRGNFCVRSVDAGHLQDDLERLGFEKRMNGVLLHAHSLRHSFSSILYLKGVSLEDRSFLMGHGNRKTNAIYTDQPIRELYEQVLKIDLPDDIAWSGTRLGQATAEASLRRAERRRERARLAEQERIDRLVQQRMAELTGEAAE